MHSPTSSLSLASAAIRDDVSTSANSRAYSHSFFIVDPVFSVFPLPLEFHSKKARKPFPGLSFMFMSTFALLWVLLLLLLFLCLLPLLKEEGTALLRIFQSVASPHSENPDGPRQVPSVSSCNQNGSRSTVSSTSYPAPSRSANSSSSPPAACNSNGSSNIDKGCTPMIPTPLWKSKGCLGRFVDTPTRCNSTTNNRDDLDLI
mmetsp:Transcript_1773/g.2527  ORF Transcript_1773/g.2527 Transcript_1773/m.2527 type:complete len:203 (+) Transcript_1773:2600-3208(+)